MITKWYGGDIQSYPPGIQSIFCHMVSRWCKFCPCHAKGVDLETREVKWIEIQLRPEGIALLYMGDVFLKQPSKYWVGQQNMYKYIYIYVGQHSMVSIT